MNMYRFNHANYYLFKVNCISFNKMYILVSAKQKLKSCTWKLQFVIHECQLLTERVTSVTIEEIWRSTDPEK